MECLRYPFHDTKWIHPDNAQIISQGTTPGIPDSSSPKNPRDSSLEISLRYPGGFFEGILRRNPKENSCILGG